MKTRNRGLSVIEVMVAIVVLATALLITIEGITFSVKATSSSAQNTEATAYARRILEILTAPGLRGAATGITVNPAYAITQKLLYEGDIGPPPPFTVQDFVRGTDPKDVRRFAENASRYTFSVTIVPYTDTITPAYTSSLFNVTVEMQWTDKMGSRAVKTGGLYHNG